MSLRVHNLTLCLFRQNFNSKISYVKNFTRNKSFKVLFFGSDSIALKSLIKINEFRKETQLLKCLDVVSSNNTSNKTEVEKYAHSAEIKTLKWPLHNLNDLKYDIGLIVAFGHLIKDDVLDKFPLGMVNVHPSLLPRWRGAAPIIHTLLHGDQETGVTLMKIKANIFDVGEIISQKKIAISQDIKLPELTNQLSDIGADMLVECIKNLPESLATARPQSKEGVTYAKKINKSIRQIRWHDMKAVEVYNLYRAIYGVHTLTSKLCDKNIKLFGAFLNNTDEVEDGAVPVGSLAYCQETKSIKVLCKDKKYIYFKSLRIVGKREISAVDFYNGYIKNTPPHKRCNLVCC